MSNTPSCPGPLEILSIAALFLCLPMHGYFGQDTPHSVKTGSVFFLHFAIVFRLDRIGHLFCFRHFCAAMLKLCIPLHRKCASLAYAYRMY